MPDVIAGIMLASITTRLAYRLSEYPLERANWSSHPRARPARNTPPIESEQKRDPQRVPGRMPYVSTVNLSSRQPRLPSFHRIHRPFEDQAGIIITHL